MTSYVIDASVAAKWFLPASGEPLSAQATALLDRYVRAEVRFIVPDLFWAELANIFWKAARLGRWSRADALSATQLAIERRFPTVNAAVLLKSAMVIAVNFDRSVYDSLYVSLAIESKTNFVTADEKLCNALAAYLPVKWIGSLI